MPPDTEYLPPRDFARLIGVSESSLAKARMRGDGPEFVKVGRSVRYSRAAGLAWMAARSRRSTTDSRPNEERARNQRRATA
jgi:predicted DNA-binding transcriptional regulator AlpA